MAQTLSSMMPLGTIAPSFELLDVVSGKQVSLSSLQSEKGIVVMFICNHCPYVIHILDELMKITKEYSDNGLSFVAISSNDVENYPEDAPEFMKLLAEKRKFNFPYLFDDSQDIAKVFQAECTPDFFVFDRDLKCVYRGRMDGSSPKNNVPLTGDDLRAALNNLISNLPIDDLQHPSIGCNIKWK